MNKYNKEELEKVMLILFLIQKVIFVALKGIEPLSKDPNSFVLAITPKSY